MKGKIVRGSGFRGCLNYILDSEKQAYIVGGNMVSRDAQGLAREFGHVRRIRSGCKKPVLHIALRMPGGEDVSDAKWIAISLDLLKILQLSNRPWCLVKHIGEHVHLVTSRVDNSGGVWTGKWEALRLISATQELEKKFGLTITPGLAGRDRRQTRLTSGQIRKFQREVERGDTPVIPAKAAIAERIKKSIADSDGTFPDFKKRIESLGVQVECNTAKTTNHISGISFKFEGVAMKGSKVARAYGWQGLSELLTERNRQYENSRNPRPAPEIIAQSDVSRAAQSRPNRTDEQPDVPGIELAGAGKDAAPALDLDGGDDGDALGELVMVGLSDSPVGAVADPLLAAAKAARFSRGNAREDCELDQGGWPEMTIS